MRLKLKQLSIEYVIVLITVAFLIVVLGFKLSLATSHSTNIRGVEPNVIFTVERMLAGHPIYENPEMPPFSVAQYTPLYYILISAATQIMSTAVNDDAMSILLIARLLSFIVSLGLSRIIYVTCRKLGAQHYLALIMTLSSLVVTIPWYILARPDVIMAFLGITALAVYMLYLQTLASKPNLRLLVIASVLAYFAILAKQSGIVFLASIGLFSLLRFNIREVIVITMSVTITFILTSFLFFPYFSIVPHSENFFYTNVVDGVRNGIDLSQAYRKGYRYLISWYSIYFILPLAITAFVFVKSVKDSWQDSLSVFLGFAWFIISAFNLATMLKIGSAIHYMNEAMIVGLFLITRIIVVYLPSDSKKNRDLQALVIGTLALFYIVSLLFFSLSSYYHLTSLNQYIWGTESREYASVISFVEDEISQNNDIYIYYSILNISNSLESSMIISYSLI